MSDPRAHIDVRLKQLAQQVMQEFFVAAARKLGVPPITTRVPIMSSVFSES